jgi:cupin 2 domain-containing protein
MNNLFAGLPADLDSEVIEILARGKNCRVERIVSNGQSSPEGFWYDQDECEWIVVLQGHAMLLVEGEAAPISLGPGDHLFIPAHRRNRVEWTSPSEPTIWLAIFFDA